MCYTRATSSDALEEKERLMKTRITTAVAALGGMAAVTLALGFGGVPVGPTGGAAAPATHSSSGIAPAHAAAGVHQATLAGCVSGLDC